MTCRNSPLGLVCLSHGLLEPVTLICHRELCAVYLLPALPPVLCLAGRSLQLRGVNLGGWLVLEKWMRGVTDASDVAAGRFAQETLIERFGPQRASTLVDTWRTHFVTGVDFDAICAAGIEAVRIPFDCRDVWGTAEERCSTAFAHMDWAVAQVRFLVAVLGTLPLGICVYGRATLCRCTLCSARHMQ